MMDWFSGRLEIKSASGNIVVDDIDLKAAQKLLEATLTIAEVHEAMYYPYPTAMYYPDPAPKHRRSNEMQP